MHRIDMHQAAGVGQVEVKLIDLGNCFSISGTDASRLSFEMQTLPFRAPEVMFRFVPFRGCTRPPSLPPFPNPLCCNVHACI